MGVRQRQTKPREIIARQEGVHFATPFCDLLTHWMEEGNEYDRSWPREGSFDPEDMALAEDCIPSLLAGAGKCITCLEKNTAGISLAIGDIKSLLSSLIRD